MQIVKIEVLDILEIILQQSFRNNVRDREDYWKWKNIGLFSKDIDSEVINIVYIVYIVYIE